MKAKYLVLAVNDTGGYICFGRPENLDDAKALSDFGSPEVRYNVSLNIVVKGKTIVYGSGCLYLFAGRRFSTLLKAIQKMYNPDLPHRLEDDLFEYSTKLIK